MEIIKQYLPEDEYFSYVTEKKTIVLHHTAGSHRPDWVIDGWDRDKTKGGKPLRVATQYVIGNRSTRGNDDDFDGKIFQAFPVDMWAHHLGTKNQNNTQLNKQAVGIEICCYGPLTKSSTGNYYTYVNSLVPEEQVIDLGKNFRGYRYYHSYSDKQIIALKYIISYLSDEYNIDTTIGLVDLIDIRQPMVTDIPVIELQKFLNKKGYLGMDRRPLVEDGDYGRNTKYALRLYNDAKTGKFNAFSYQPLANEGGSGIWSHSNYRKDKFDVYPHPKLIEMLKSL